MAKKNVNQEADELCGHINRHSLGVDGLPDNMSCILPKGHPGAHRGRHLVRRTVHQVEKKHIVGEKVTSEKEEESEWLDGAGIPVDEAPAVVEIKPKTLAEQEFGVNAKTVMSGM